MTDPNVRNDPFGSFAVDRVTREDGRYLLYYAWPGAAGRPDDEARSPGRPAERAEPWTPEAQPETDV